MIKNLAIVVLEKRPTLITTSCWLIRRSQSPTLKENEPNSQTAEFSPRVRLTHPKLKGADLQALIADTPNQALLVRVTGVQMFDSEHSLGPFPLKRHNNWEIHPVFKLEYCPEDKTCEDNSDANWVDMEQGARRRKMELLGFSPKALHPRSGVSSPSLQVFARSSLACKLQQIVIGVSLKALASAISVRTLSALRSWTGRHRSRAGRPPVPADSGVTQAGPDTLRNQAPFKLLDGTQCPKKGTWATPTAETMILHTGSRNGQFSDPAVSNHF